MAFNNNKTKVQYNAGTVRTHQGGDGQTNSEKLSLALIATSTFGEDAFYENKENLAQRMIDLVSSIGRKDPKFIEDLALVARQDFNMRTMPVALLAVSTLQNGMPQKSTLDGVFLRGDELAEFAAVVKYATGKVNDFQVLKTLRYGLNLITERKALRYSGKNRDFSLADIIRIAHPKPKNDKQSALFKFIMSWNIQGSVAKGISKLSLKELNSLPFVRDAANNENNEKVSWERAISNGASWESVVKDMGYMALLRNLNNLLKNIPAQNREIWNYVIEKLRNETEIKNSKQLPYRFYSATRAVIGSPTTNPMQARVLTALQDALEISASNIEQLNGRTLVISDVSSSMSWTKVSGNSDVSALELSTIFGAALAKYQNADYVVFSSTAKKVPFANHESIITIADRAKTTVRNYGTEIATVNQVVNVEEYDNIIVFSDEQLADSYHYSDSFKKFVKNIKKAKVYTVGLAAYDVTASVLSENNRNVVKIAGWSDKVFTLIGKINKGNNFIDWIGTRASEIRAAQGY